MVKRNQFYILLGMALFIINLILGINNGFAAEEPRITSVNSFAKFEFNFIQQTADRGFIMVGPQGTLKVDSQMKKQWALENPPAIQPAIPNWVAETQDGYVIIETKDDTETVFNRVYLIKTDKQGQIAWKRDFGIDKFDYYGKYCQETVDGGYIILGMADNYRQNYLYLIKTDAEGNKLWEKNLGGGEILSGNSVLPTKDGGYIIAGGKITGNKQKSDVYMIKTDSLGNIQWEHTYGGTENDSARAILETPDGYMLTGVKGIGQYTGDVYLIRTDFNGKALWERTYGQKPNDEQGYKTIKTNDGGFLILGHEYRMQGSIYLVKVDNEGNKQWDKYISSSPGCTTGGRAIFQRDNGDYLLIAEKGILAAAYVHVKNMTINISNKSGSGNVKVLLNEKHLKSDVSPLIIGGRTFLPVRAISEALGATVTWRQLDKTIVITKKNRAVELRLDCLDATVFENEQPKDVELDAPPFIVNGRTLVPVRFISEFFGAKVIWDGQTQTVKIKTI